MHSQNGCDIPRNNVKAEAGILFCFLFCFFFQYGSYYFLFKNIKRQESWAIVKNSLYFLYKYYIYAWISLLQNFKHKIKNVSSMDKMTLFFNVLICTIGLFKDGAFFMVYSLKIQRLVYLQMDSSLSTPYATKWVVCVCVFMYKALLYIHMEQLNQTKFLMCILEPTIFNLSVNIYNTN